MGVRCHLRFAECPRRACNFNAPLTVVMIHYVGIPPPVRFALTFKRPYHMSTARANSFDLGDRCSGLDWSPHASEIDRSSGLARLGFRRK